MNIQLDEDDYNSLKTTLKEVIEHLQTGNTTLQDTYDLEAILETLADGECYSEDEGEEE